MMHHNRRSSLLRLYRKFANSETLALALAREGEPEKLLCRAFLDSGC